MILEAKIGAPAPGLVYAEAARNRMSVVAEPVYDVAKRLWVASAVGWPEPA